MLRKPMPHSVSTRFERLFGIGGAFHVDADEEVQLRRHVEHSPNVVDRRRAVDIEAELCQLHRDVPADAGLGDGLDDGHVLAGGWVASSRVVTRSPR